MCLPQQIVQYMNMCRLLCVSTVFTCYEGPGFGSSVHMYMNSYCTTHGVGISGRGGVS